MALLTMRDEVVPSEDFEDYEDFKVSSDDELDYVSSRDTTHDTTLNSGIKMLLSLGKEREYPVKVRLLWVSWHSEES